MLMAAMLAMVLAAAAPAIGQGDIGDVNQGDDQFNVGDETVYSAVCQNIIGSFQANAGQGAFGGAFAQGGENAVAAVEIAQEQNVSVSQVNRCLNASAAAATAAPAAHVAAASPTATATATAAAAAQYQYATGTATASPTATASATALPPTCGLGLSGTLALGAGALLVAGGLIARRIVR
jgi:hypothetical protein